MTETRYGVFLRPDAATCWNVTQITFAIQRQFGLVSAGAFPPHATLVGNVATAGSAKDLVEVLNPVFGRARRFPVYNSGIVRSSGYSYNVNLDASGRTPNAPLNRLAAEVRTAVLPLYTVVDDFLVPRLQDYHFAGHLGLASHELSLDDHLEQQIGEFIETLPLLSPPARFDARWCSLFRFESDWAGHWWETMTWEHVHSWELV